MMLFTHTWQAVIEGRKTQTRRLVKAGEWQYWDCASLEGGKDAVFRGEGIYPHCVYQCKKTYAVQPGRGKPAIWWRENAFGLEYAHSNYDIDNDNFEDIDAWWTQALALSDYEHLDGNPLELQEYGYQQARIRITDIRREDVREISDANVKAEGFESRLEFWQTWVSMHDKQFKKLSENQSWWNIEDILRIFIKDRPKERYDAWALTFELVNAVNPLPFDGPLQDTDYPSPIEDVQS